MQWRYPDCPCKSQCFYNSFGIYACIDPFVDRNATLLVFGYALCIIYIVDSNCRNQIPASEVLRIRIYMYAFYMPKPGNLLGSFQHMV